MSEAQVLDALGEVLDPELGLDIVTLGLVYDVRIVQDSVEVTHSLTSPGCPFGPQMAREIVATLTALDGVTAVKPELVFTPQWTPEKMSDDARFALGL